MILFALSDAVLAQLITATLTLIGTCFSGYLTYLMAKLNKDTNRQAGIIANEAHEVKNTLADNNRASIHKLTNIQQISTTTNDLIALNTEAIKTTSGETFVKLKSIEATTQKAEKLANGTLTEQLRLNMVVTQQLAAHTKEAIHIEAARLAEQKYNKHVEEDKKLKRETQ